MYRKVCPNQKGCIQKVIDIKWNNPHVSTDTVSTSGRQREQSRDRCLMYLLPIHWPSCIVMVLFCYQAEMAMIT